MDLVFKTYMSKEARKRKSLVASESKHLARCRCNICYATASCQNDEDGRHDRSSSVGFCCNEERLDEWHDIGVGEDSFHISEAETECDQHYEAERTIDEDSPHHSARQSEGGILDFLRHLHKSVLFASFFHELKDLRELRNLDQ